MPEFLITPEGDKVTKAVDNPEELIRSKDRAQISEINCKSARKEANQRRRRELEGKKAKQKEDDLVIAKRNPYLAVYLEKKTGTLSLKSGTR